MGMNINGRIDLEGGNILNSGSWAHDVNNSLVDSHFVSIPSVGTFTAWGLSNSDSKGLGWDSLWTSNFETISVVGLLGSQNDVSASIFEWLDESTSHGHCDSLNIFEVVLIDLLFVCVHI